MTRVVRLLVVGVAAVALLLLQGQGAQALPPCDVVFKIDESGSMCDDIAQVKARVQDIADQLDGECDYQLGLVAYGASAGGGAPVIKQTLTSDVPTFQAAVNSLVCTGGFQPGFAATVLAESDAMGTFQSPRPCDILISDEDADDYGDHAGEKAAALAALNDRGAAFLAVVTDYGTSEDDYGPAVGSLAEATGGATFDLIAFRADPGPVLEAVIDKCIEEAKVGPPVGGIARPAADSGVVAAPADSSGSSTPLLAALAGAAAAAVAVVAAGGWYARRRWIR